MIKEQYFPTNIYGKDIKIDNNKLSEDIIKWSKQDSGLKKTNVNGWHSTTDMATKEEYKILVDEILTASKEVFKEEFLERKPIIGNMWANINPPGATNTAHIHPNAHFSGVYYVNTDSKSGPLKIMDPRPGVQMVMPIRQKEELPKHLWRDAFLDPFIGRILMFPAWLWHSVETNESDKLRISVSFNIVQEGF
tara:strand:- start:359 stop:937 length:579 start_codon:yes stop_codon:yes gene_type:complete